MEYARLGDTGVLVSELCLGCMTFGREVGADDTRKMVERFVGAGGNFLDTANVYSSGVSEEVTGEAIKPFRDDVILATKVRNSMGDGPNDVGLSRRHIIKACEDSLRRLGTDYIDLYQLHCWDNVAPLDETLHAISDLVTEGKVRYVGVSNFSGWQLQKAMDLSDALGYHRFVSLQPQYSLVERNIEYEVLPVCDREGVGVIPWGPLGGGFLSGKYRKGEAPPEDSRIATAGDDWEEAWHRRATDRNWAIVDVMGTISEETGKSYAQIALNWLLCKDGVTSPIIGARTMDQLEDNLGATGWRLSHDQVARLDEVSRPPDIYPYGFIEKNLR
jgi:aryl-alcohol dehydrogenase-like predicted oxidoreductase